MPLLNFNHCPVCNHDHLSELLQLKDYFFSKQDFTILECQNCQLRFTQPRPSEEELPSYYNSDKYISHKVNKLNIKDFIYHQVRRITISRKYNLINAYQPGGCIMDVGCGTGELLNYFSHRNWETLGIEPSEMARNQAATKYGLRVLDESALESLPENSFDVITLWHVLEHVPQPKERISQLSRLLKPNGLLVLALPNSNSWDAAAYGRFWAAYDVPRHLYHFTQKSLIRLMNDFPFMHTASLPMKLDAYYISILSEKYKNGKSRLFPALHSGFKSNRFARYHQNEYSSLIYLFKKTE